MITETRQSRTRLLHTYERHPHRRHHTLDNATLDKFDFICIPLHIDENHIDTSTVSQTNLIKTSSNENLIPKPTEFTSPTRRVRFKFDDNQHIQSSDDIREPKKYSTHRVEYQIPLHKNINACIHVDCSSTPAKTRSITSQKIDINYNNNNHNNPIHLQNVSSFIDSPIVRKK